MWKAKDQISVKAKVQEGKEKKSHASQALKRTSLLEHVQDVTFQSNDAKPILIQAPRLQPPLHENQNPKLITTIVIFYD